MMTCRMTSCGTQYCWLLKIIIICGERISTSYYNAMYIYATLCIRACTALASCTHSRPHSFLQRRRARPARECRMWELEVRQVKISGYIEPWHQLETKPNSRYWKIKCTADWMIQWMTDRHTDDNVLLLDCCCQTGHSWHHWNPPISRLSEKIFCSPSTTLRSFGSPDHFSVFVLRNAYRSWFVGFFAKKWPVFQVKNLTLIRICDIYASMTWMPKS